MKKCFLMFAVSLGIIFAGPAMAGNDDEGAFNRAGKSIDSGINKTKEFFTDSAITARVKKRLSRDDYVSVFNFNITTSKGVVTVKGEADSEKIAQRVIDITRATKGVKNVNNNIMIISKSPSSSR